MSCRALEQSLLLHAHGQSTGMLGFWVDAHLRGCPSCREKWARWVLEKDAMRRALSPAPELDPTAERLMTAVAVRIRTEPRDKAPVEKRNTLAAYRKPARVLALTALIALLASAAAALAALQPLAGPNLGFLPSAWRPASEPCRPPLIGPGPNGIVPPGISPKAAPASPTTPSTVPKKTATKAAADACLKRL